MALSSVVSEIFNVEKCDLEIGVKVHWRSLKVVPLDRLCMVSYKFCLVIRTGFEIFDLEVYSHLETRVRGHSRSLKIIPLNPAGTHDFLLTFHITIVAYLAPFPR